MNEDQLRRLRALQDQLFSVTDDVSKSRNALNATLIDMRVQFIDLSGSCVDNLNLTLNSEAGGSHEK